MIYQLNQTYGEKMKFRFLITVLQIFIVSQSLVYADVVEYIGDDENQITVVYLKGSPYEMGFIHGSLLKPQVRSLYDSVLTAAAKYANLYILDAAYKQLEPFIPQAYKEEMQGLADGAGVKVRTVHRMHAIPDVSEMDCTFFAAWDSATVDGNLYQIRALDYAKNLHLQEHPAIFVCEPDSGNRFVNIGWLGFIGVVSGMNYEGISVSEIGESFDRANQTMAGEPMPFVLRDVLQYATGLDQAVEIIRTAKRTSSFLYCVGDAKIPEAKSFKTGASYFDVFSDSTSPNPFLKDVVYFSMGVSSSWNAKVFNYLNPRHGGISAQTGVNLMRDLGTGDLHSVVYDPAHQKIWVANAGIDETDAFRRSFVLFDLTRADTIFAGYSVSDVHQKSDQIAKKYFLAQNYPNPFNPATQIDFEISATSGNERIELSVFNLSGQKIATLAQGIFTPGAYHYTWNGCNQSGRRVSSGLYLYRLTSGTFTQVRRMVLIR